MKYTAAAYHLSLATLLAVVGTTTSSASTSTQLRGTQEEEINSLAPPRVFSEEHSYLLHNDVTTTIVSPQQPSLSSTAHRQSRARVLQSRALQTSNNCNTNEQSLQIILTPDKHTDTDNSFTISIRQNGRWVELHSHSGTLPSSSFNMCLVSSGRYRFEAIDSYSDGILNGGKYEVVLNGEKIFTTSSGDWSRNVHKFDIELTNNNADVADTERVEELPEEENVIVEEEEEVGEMQLLMADEEFMSTSIPTSVMVMTKKPTKKPTPQPTSSSSGGGSNSGGSGGASSTTSPPSSKPSSKPTSKPTPAAESSPSGSTQTVSTGVMTEREHQWLDEHNIRREKYHKQKGKPYAPLKWSKFLRDSAQEWAEECARTGVFDHAWHLNIGENMARHTTTGDGYRHPSNILERWVEKEMKVGYPDNGHMTQCLWRATEYVGCGEAKKGNKYYQVCQYSKPGNCGVNRNDFWSSVLADDSGCKGMPLLY